MTVRRRSEIKQFAQLAPEEAAAAVFNRYLLFQGGEDKALRIFDIYKDEEQYNDVFLANMFLMYGCDMGMFIEPESPYTFHHLNEVLSTIFNIILLGEVDGKEEIFLNTLGQTIREYFEVAEVDLQTID